MNFDTIEPENLVAMLGFEYKVSTGNSGVQINVRDCPNCGATGYKVYLNYESGLGNCFKCNIGFNKFKFAYLYFNKDGKALNKFFNVNYDDLRYYPRKSEKKSKVSLERKDWKLPYFIETKDSKEATDYLTDRKITDKLITRFNLKYCAKGSYTYKDFDDVEQEVNFSKRIIIPIFDIEGKLVTFQGRDITGKSNRKYLFPNRLPGTGRFIYNSHYAINNKAKICILNEGVFDVFATTNALESDVAFKDYCAIGSFGKNLSMQSSALNLDDQLSDLFKLQKNGVERFVILWDGEREANLAALKACLKAKSYGLNFYVSYLPRNCDPAESTELEILDSISKAFVPSKLDLLRFRLNATE